MKEFDYPDFDWIIVDNSVGSSYTSKLRRSGYTNVHHIKRGKNTRETLSNSQNYIRRYFLNGDYDFLLLLESDLVPEKHILRKLVANDLFVCGVPYYIGFGNNKTLCVFFNKKKDNVDVWGTRLITPVEISEFVKDGKLQKVHGVGFGCTLIRRDIVERFPFWNDERFEDKHSDVYFYMDLNNNGIPVYVDTSLFVKHYPSDWKKVKDR